MTRSARMRRTALVLTALTAVVLLAGCTAQPQPAAVPARGTTAAPATAQGFVCPTRAEVAGLTAVPFTDGTASGGACTYSTARDASAITSVTVRHPAGGGNLAAMRSAAIGRGAATQDAGAIAFDAFTTTAKGECIVSFPAADGEPTSVTARRSGASRTELRRISTAVATLVGSGTSARSQPTVTVIAPKTLLGTATDQQRWPWRIGSRAAVRIDRLTGSGYLGPLSATSYARIAAGVPADSAAVVFVSGTAEAGTSSLTLLRDATRALSAAAGRAPKAELVVVGPVSDGSASADEVAGLRDDLQAVARIAGAEYVDPAPAADAAGAPSAALSAVADGVVDALRSTDAAG